MRVAVSALATNVSVPGEDVIFVLGQIVIFDARTERLHPCGPLLLKRAQAALAHDFLAINERSQRRTR